MEENKTQEVVSPELSKKQKKDSKSFLSNILDDVLSVVSFLIGFPLYLILLRVVPDVDWVGDLDRTLLFAGVLLLVFLLMNWMRWLSITGVLLAAGFLTYGSFADGYHYGWNNAVLDYKSLMHSAVAGDDPVTFILNTVENPTQRAKFVEKCDYSNEVVRNYAMDCIEKEKEFKEIADKSESAEFAAYIHACAICKQMHKEDGGWHYVSDPAAREYFAKASESIQLNLKGDCDDHAICMASCALAVGAKARIILATGVAVGHAYPELGIRAKDWDNMRYLIEKELFPKELEGKPLYYHKEGDYYWLNMDYTGVYPGTEYMEGVEEYSVINIIAD